MSQKNQNQNNGYSEGLKRIAQAQLESDETLLCRWWSNKYNLPTNDPRLLSMTFEELYIEFLLDEISNKSNSPQTEDPDKWKNELTEEHDKYIKRRLKKEEKVDLSKFVNMAKKREETESEEFEDTY